MLSSLQPCSEDMNAGNRDLTTHFPYKVQQWASRFIVGPADTNLIKNRLLDGEIVRVLTPVQVEVMPPGYRVLTSEMEFLQHATGEEPLLVRGNSLSDWAEVFFQARGVPYGEAPSPTHELQAFCPDMTPEAVQALLAQMGDAFFALPSALAVRGGWAACHDGAGGLSQPICCCVGRPRSISACGVRGKDRGAYARNDRMGNSQCYTMAHEANANLITLGAIPTPGEEMLLRGR
jgi:hypothetical protein